MNYNEIEEEKSLKRKITLIINITEPANVTELSKICFHEVFFSSFSFGLIVPHSSAFSSTFDVIVSSKMKKIFCKRVTSPYRTGLVVDCAARVSPIPSLAEGTFVKYPCGGLAGVLSGGIKNIPSI